MDKLLQDELSRQKGSDTKSKRRINIDLLAAVMTLLMPFLFAGRWTKTKAHAMVMAFSKVVHLHKQHFHKPFVKLCKDYLKENIFLPWKFQRAIDLEEAGGLNYRCLNALRVFVEELGFREKGLILEKTAVRESAQQLEEYAEGLGLKTHHKMT